MKNHILFVLSLALFFTACNTTDGPGDGCRDVSVERGIISQVIEFSNCFVFDKIEEEYLIEDSAAYAALKSEIIDRANACSNADFPEIDFSEFALLGLWATGTGCSTNFFQSVGDLPDSKEYVYTVTVQECGSCEPLAIKYNWVLVPKLPSGYTVKYQVKYIR